MIKNLIFDVDGTIWDSTAVVARGWNRAIEEAGYPDLTVTPQALSKEFGLTMDVIAEHLFGDVADPEERQRLLEKCCLYEEQALEENEEDIAYPGLREGMEKLSERYKLYIASNCQCGYIELVVRKCGISHLIEDFECFGNTGTCKGETIRILMERAGMRREETVYIGDTRGDYEACGIAGIPFLFAEYGFGEVEEAGLKIHKFSELEDVLERM